MTNIQVRAKLTSKGQITIPIAARQALNLQEGDQVAFRVLDGGKVEIFKEVSIDSDDSVVAAYLAFLERDMIRFPQKLMPHHRGEDVDALVEGVDLTDWLDQDQVS